MGDTPSAPAPPDYAAANREAILADIETLPQRLKTQSEAELGLGQFAGLGQADKLKQQLDIIAQSAPALAQSQLDIQKQYGTQFADIARQEAAAIDPTRAALQEYFNTQALQDLQSGGDLTPDQRRMVEESTREAQTARGNVFGVAPTIDEALAKFDYATKLKTQRQNVAATALGLGGVSNEVVKNQAAQQGTAPYNPYIPQLSQNLNPNAGAQGAQFALQSYGIQSQNWATQMAQSNPWMSGLGLIGGIGTSLGSAALFCWVAREVYGKDNPRWFIFREWLKTKAPKWFFWAYRTFGEKFAQFISNKPKIKDMIKPFFDSKVEDMLWQE